MEQNNTLNHRIPSDLKKILGDFKWEVVTIGCSKTKVHKLVKGNETLYLKINRPLSEFTLEKEKEILEWLDDRLPVPNMLYFCNFKHEEFLLLSEIEGKVSYQTTSEDEKRNHISILAEGLKTIHSLDFSNCPVDNTPDNLINIAKSRMNRGLINSKNFDEGWSINTPEELFDKILENKPEKYDIVFCHGDYCLPNILIKDGKLSGFVDWCYGGLNDRYFDLVAVAWSIEYNFGQQWVKRFFDDYGLKDIDWEKFKFFQKLNAFFQLSYLD